MSAIKELPDVNLVKISREEFAVYAKWSVKNYADNLIDSGTEKFRFKAKKEANTKNVDFT